MQLPFCEVGADVLCPGTGGTQCSGNQCCEGIPESQGATFPCPSAELNFTGCERPAKVSSCVACLCSFDIDRTLTARQGDERCKDALELGIYDTAYEGGKFTLSSAGQSLERTFCHSCFAGIVTAGTASGYMSRERMELQRRLSAGRPSWLTPAMWSGPSHFRENRGNCANLGQLDGTFVVGCRDGTKHHAVQKMLDWLEARGGVNIPKERVWHFDDRLDVIEPFALSGINAREVSCAARDWGNKGLCGASPEEIQPEVGVVLCPSTRETG